MSKWTVSLLLVFTITVKAQTKPIATLIDISDSLERNEKYTEAISFWAKNKKGAPQIANNYLAYFEYWSDYEHQPFAKIVGIEKSLASIERRKAYESEFLVKIFSQHYHHLAESGMWQQALGKGLEGYELTDFGQAKSTTKTDYLYDIGFMYSETGNYFEAVRFYNESLQLYIKQNGQIDAEVALNYNNLAFNYGKSGNRKKSLENYERAAAIWSKVFQHKTDKNDYLITVYHNLVNDYILYGDIDKAKKSALRLNAIFATKYKSPNSRQLPTYFEAKKKYVLTNVRIAVLDNKIAEAENLIRDLRIEPQFSFKNSKDIIFLLQCYNEIIDNLFEHHRYDEMKIVANTALKLATKYGQKHYIMSINSYLSNSYYEEGHYELALKYNAQAIRANANTNFSSSKYTLKIAQAHLYQKLQKYTIAKSIATENIEQLALDCKKKSVKVEDIKYEDVNELVAPDFINIFSKTAELFLLHSTSGRNSTDEEKEIEIAKKLFTIAGKLFHDYYLNGEYNESLYHLHQAISEGILECVLTRETSMKEKIKAINLIEQNESQHLAKEYYKKLKRNNAATTPKIELLNELKSELLFYRNRKTEDKIDPKRNASKKIEIEHKIQLLEKEINNSEKNYLAFNTASFDIEELMRELHKNEQLIKYYVTESNVYSIIFMRDAIKIHKLGPTKELKELTQLFVTATKNRTADYFQLAIQLYRLLIPQYLNKSLTIIPTSFLSYLPFEALYDNKTKEFVVQVHTVSYDYSLPLWLLHRTQNTNPNRKLIAFSPAYYPISNHATRSKLVALKYTRIESESIVNLYNGKLFAKEKATKENFLKEKQHFGIYHLSMHSQLVDDDFNKSCLVFSKGEKLYFSEMYSLNFPASMVVLSACDTGNGLLKNGEGIMSLSRALTYSGVDASVVSLWPIPDKETAEIMILFYKNLKEGQSKDIALANAKTTFMKHNPMKNHPFYWAGFIINGNSSPIVNTHYWVEFIGITIVILIFLLYFFKSRLFQISKQSDR